MEERRNVRVAEGKGFSGGDEEEERSESTYSSLFLPYSSLFYLSFLNSTLFF